MNCLRLDAKNERLIYKKSEIPKVTHDKEVVIKVVLAGVCGTDLHIVEGKFNAADGVVLGHEFVGIIHEVPKISSFKVGERVLVNPNITCGVCFYCKRSQFNFCQQGGMNYTIGISVDGGFAEYCKAHISMVFKMPSSVQFEQAVLCEPISCITHGLDIMGEIPIGSKILILGAGIIGLLWCGLLHHLGHRNVYVVQRSVGRRKTVNELGLGYKCISWEEFEACQKDCPEYKLDYVIDGSGNTDAMFRALPHLQKGGKLIIFGVADPAKKIEVSPFEIYKMEMTIIGIQVNTNPSFQRAINFIEAMGDKYFTFEKLNIRTYKLEEYETAFKDLNDRKYTKIVFKF
ncbi:hypothetical protein PGB90_009137 [Kerria lacca]